MRRPSQIPRLRVTRLAPEVAEPLDDCLRWRGQGGCLWRRECAVVHQATDMIDERAELVDRRLHVASIQGVYCTL